MRRLLLTLCALGVAALAVAGFLLYESRLPGTLALQFRARFDGAPLQFNHANYANPGGEGQFSIRDFQFFLSNIKLISADGDFHVADSYHLVRFDNKAALYSIMLRNVPRRSYRAIQFGIGVDPDANGSLESVGDLDPNSRMAWNWEVGYKFVLFEGTLIHGGMRRPLVYHVGFDENYKEAALVIGRGLFEQPTETLRFDVDVMALFGSTNPIDMAKLSSVKFDRADASRIAAGFSLMIKAPVHESGPNLFERMFAK